MKTTTPEPLTIEAITVPQGVELDKDAAGKLLGILNDGKLDGKSRAQGLFDLHNQLIQAAVQKNLDGWAAMQAKWNEEAKADPVIGGDKLDPALGSIAKLIDKYSVGQDGKPDAKMAESIREAMDLTGAGNNPWVLRLLAGIAKDLALEGGPITATNPATAALSQADRMFPSQPKAA